MESTDANPPFFDVLIVGAGLSGIGAAVHLKQQCPNHSFAILEGRSALGGTWDLFRYPGIRSDSDMHTMGYEFRPWKADKAIADGPSILRYIQDTAREYDIEQHIRTDHWVKRAQWDSASSTWRLEITRTETEETVILTGRVLYMCAGYYSYKGGYTPKFEGLETFKGPIIHPQEWPEDFDYRDQKVVVIGSGATAITLIPTMADATAHITMLQRSPTYIFAWPDRDWFANTLRRILPAHWAYALTRFKNITLQQLFYRMSQRNPKRARDQLIRGVRQSLGPDYDVETHFQPRYNPWEQRLCLAPNGDFFEAIKSGKATVVTDHIERFTPTGIQLKSGDHLEADAIVTATGLNVVAFGDIALEVDGTPITWSNEWSYKGLAISNVPNFFACFGYINASWTLRADLTSAFLCRVLNHMAQTGAKRCVPTLRPEDQGMEARNWIEGFTPGYLTRVHNGFPRQGDRSPWLNPQNYKKDIKMLRKAPIDDGVLCFDTP